MSGAIASTLNSDTGPCLRWAGGKRRHLLAMEAVLPSQFGLYFEPMVGGAALFLRMQPSRAVLGDINAELMGFYQILRDRTEELIWRLSHLKASREMYYSLRESEPTDPVDVAVRFAYLNRLCWNGLYRVNREGKFNVPIGSRLPTRMWNFDNMRQIACSLRKVTLFCGDFSECVATASEGDFVYLDPPYPRGSSDGLGFNRYSSVSFSYDEHVRLARTADDLSRRGVLVLVSETADPRIVGLFSNDFVPTYLDGKSLISGRAAGRRAVREALLRNYCAG